MPATSALGARLYTSAVALDDVGLFGSSIEDFYAVDLDVECGLVTNLGELGRVFETVTFTDIQGRTRKLKGAYNDGMIRLSVGQDLTDTGQFALRSYAALANQRTYPFRIEFVQGASFVSDDAGDSATSDTSFMLASVGDSIFFGVKVMSFRTVVNNAGSVVRATMLLEVNTPIFFFTN